MENIKSYLDGELDLAQQTEVETHLRNDAELQKMVDDFRSISATLKTADIGEPYGAEKLEERLNAAGNSRAKSDKRIWRLALYWSATAACFGIFAAILFPVFAQAKVAAKKSVDSSRMGAALSMAKSANPSAGFQERPRQETYHPVAPGASPGLQEQNKFETGAGRGENEGSIANGQVAQDAESLRQPGEPNGDSTLDKASADTAAGKDLTTTNGRTGFRNGGGGSITRAQSKGTAGVTMGDYAKEKKAEEPESKFKADMRQYRDKQLNPSSSTTLNDTPHGIYLERSGQIQVKVDDLMRSVDEATGMVQSLDGFVMNHDLQNEEDGGSATMTLRVPTKNYNAAMNKLQGMGEVISVNSASQDITTETVDNSTRMISWADEEKRLMDELAKAKNNDERYRIRQLLATTRANLAAYRETVKSLKERAEYSTINVNFVRGDKAEKAGASSNWSSSAFKDAKSGLGSVGQVLGVICIYAGVFAPVWLPFVIAAYIIRKRNQS